MNKNQETTPTMESDADFGRSEVWLRGLVDQTLAGIYVVQDGYFRYANQYVADMYGYASPGDLIDKINIMETIAPEERPRIAENIRRRTEGSVQEMRYSFIGLRRDGRRIVVEVHGRSTTFKGRPAVMGLALDVTERTQAEAERLAAAAEHITATVFEAQESMVITDAEHKILRVNQAFIECTGLSADEAVGQDITRILSINEDDVIFANSVLDAVQRLGSWKGEFWGQRKNGERFPCWVTITAVKNRDGMITHHVGMLTDISESKRLEAEMAQRIKELGALNERLEEAQTQLLQAEKMAAVGQLAAGIAHEINNPVGFVNSNLGTLRQYVGNMITLIDAYHALADDCPNDHPALPGIRQLNEQMDFDFVREDALALLDESKDGLERVKRIVSDLRDFSRVGESDWQIADLHKCLDSTLNVVFNELKYKATIVKEYGTLPEIRCMPFQLNQVFMNLLVNAAHAITDHGTIILRTGCDAETVWVEIEDSGVGIPAENLKRIFEPFFTTKPVGQGTGLGLSVSYGIVQKHKGCIEVRSEPGKGSVFRVTLLIDPNTGDSRTLAR